MVSVWQAKWWRAQNGSFTTKEQLLEVKGAGEKILAKNTERVAL